MEFTDKEIVEALIARDARITQQFFFKDCRPLFLSIINKVFDYKVDYNEFVNEFYLYLMENDACRLKQFEGRSTIYQWLKIVAIRYFISKRDSLIDNESNDAPLDSVIADEFIENETMTTARLDVERLFSLMSNKRYVYVIRRLVLEEAEPKVVAAELATNVDNLYNIKKRAIAAITEIALKDIERYEKESGK